MSIISQGGYFLIALIGLTMAVGCSKSSHKPDPPVSGLSLIQLDSVWVYNSELMRKVVVRAENIDLTNRTILGMIVAENGDSLQFRLYDDGNEGDWNDADQFAAGSSGDIVPGDFVFARQINSQFADNTGEYSFSFTLSESNSPELLITEILVRHNSPPDFISHSEDDSVFSGGFGDIFTVTLADAEGQGDIVGSEVVIFRSTPPSGNASYFDMHRSLNNQWSWNDKAPISTGLMTGVYPAAFRAQDKYLHQIDGWAYSDTFSVWLENLPPSITSVEGPDTIWIPRQGGDTVYFDFSVIVEDDQGVTDLDTLYLNLFIADSGEVWRNFYIDGWGLLDTIALDGIYRPGFSADSSNTTPRTFLFKWTPIDKTGQRGEVFETYLVFRREEGNRIQSALVNDFDKFIHQQSHSPFK